MQCIKDRHNKLGSSLHLFSLNVFCVKCETLKHIDQNRKKQKEKTEKIEFFSSCSNNQTINVPFVYILRRICDICLETARAG